MCIEYAIALGILCVIALLGIVATFKLAKLESKYDDLMDGYIRQEDLIREQWGQIEELEMELAKKDSLISILKLEIEEKENV